jgi:hypothetical protein
MRVKRAVITIIGVGLVAASAAPAGAERVMSGEHQIVVRGVVPELRTVVIDEQQRIRLVTSNTPNPVLPRVMLLAVGGPEVPLAREVREQYEVLMQQVRDDKVVTISPAPAPLADLLPNFTKPTIRPRYEVKPARYEGTGAGAYWISGAQEPAAPL